MNPIPNWLKVIIEFFKGLRGPQVSSDRKQDVNSPSLDAVEEATSAPEPREEAKPQPVEAPKESVIEVVPSLYPEMDPNELRRLLRKEVNKKGTYPQGWESIADDPKTAEDERRTFCNFFVREVASWEPYNWRNFEFPDRDQAGEITLYMRNHPEFWEKVSMEESRFHACKGRLVICGYVYPKPENAEPGKWHASGHVAIGAPEVKMRLSGKWQKKLPVIANVGSTNFYGKLSYAFRPSQAPEFFVLRKKAPHTA